jgi:hypothetical protein
MPHPADVGNHRSAGCGDGRESTSCAPLIRRACAPQSPPSSRDADGEDEGTDREAHAKDDDQETNPSRPAPEPAIRAEICVARMQPLAVRAADDGHLSLASPRFPNTGLVATVSLIRGTLP